MTHIRVFLMIIEYVPLTYLVISLVIQCRFSFYNDVQRFFFKADYNFKIYI